MTPEQSVTGPPQERLSPSQELLRYFAHDHLPAPLFAISGACAYLAETMEDQLPDGPEKTVGLRKLLEAKDCFVRAALPPAPAYPLIPKDDSLAAVDYIKVPAEQLRTPEGVQAARDSYRDHLEAKGITADTIKQGEITNDKAAPPCDICGAPAEGVHDGAKHVPVDASRCECGKVWLHENLVSLSGHSRQECPK